MKKILTILGTRPEIIRLSEIIKILDNFSRQRIIHTGQNYNYNLDKVFFENFKLRKPDLYLGARGTFAQQIAKIIRGVELEIKKYNPDCFLVLGDTNSSLGAIAAKRLSVPVYHLEAGNRSFIKNSPEEVNRKIIDHCSDIWMPYSNRSAENLVREGIPRHKIFVVGNPITEVLQKNKQQIDESKILKKLNILSNKYFLLTLHREENVDVSARLNNFIEIFSKIILKFKLPIIWPIHPRTKKKIKNAPKLNKLIKIIEPQSFFDFAKLEKNALCILTDSGTVQEEASILKIPSIILRENTERPETIESGSSIIDDSPLNIIENINICIQSKDFIETPIEYKNLKPSFTCAKIILGR